MKELGTREAADAISTIYHTFIVSPNNGRWKMENYKHICNNLDVFSPTGVDLSTSEPK